MLVRQQERCHNALAICPACIGNISESDRLVFDGMGRTNPRRGPYGLCKRDRDSRNVHDNHFCRFNTVGEIQEILEGNLNTHLLPTVKVYRRI